MSLVPSYHICDDFPHFPFSTTTFALNSQQRPRPKAITRLLPVVTAHSIRTHTREARVFQRHWVTSVADSARLQNLALLVAPRHVARPASALARAVQRHDLDRPLRRRGACAPPGRVRRATQALRREAPRGPRPNQPAPQHKRVWPTPPIEGRWEWVRNERRVAMCS